MQLKFNLDINDLMAFQKNYYKNSNLVKKQKIVVLAFLPAMMALVLLVDYIENDQFSFILLALSIFGSIIWIIYQNKTYYKQLLKKVKKIMVGKNNTSMTGDKELELNETELIFKEENSEQKVNWDGVAGYRENDTYYFIYLSSVSGIVIPKNKVNLSKTEQEELHAILTKHTVQLP